MLLEAYQRSVSQARSLNSLNQINIAYGNTMTPQEVVELEEALSGSRLAFGELRPDRVFTDADLETVTSAWIRDALLHLKMIGKVDAEPFLRRDLRQSVTLYTDGRSSAGKSLVIALPGNNNRLMMPVATLLQALDATNVDIVLIRDPTHSAYFHGLEGFADSRERLFDILPQYLNFEAYGGVSTLGVSAGGLPALLLALRLGLRAALTCGANSPFDPRLQEKGGPAAVAALHRAIERGHDAHLAIAFGAQQPEDRRGAMELAEILGVGPIEIASNKREVKHNVLVPIAEEGRLSSFLAEHLKL